MQEDEGKGAKSLYFLSKETESQRSEMSASMEARTRHLMMRRVAPGKGGPQSVCHQYVCTSRDGLSHGNPVPGVGL